jgi:hypothetical protein
MYSVFTSLLGAADFATSITNTSTAISGSSHPTPTAEASTSYPDERDDVFDVPSDWESKGSKGIICVIAWSVLASFKQYTANTHILR